MIRYQDIGVAAAAAAAAEEVVVRMRRDAANRTINARSPLRSLRYVYAVAGSEGGGKAGSRQVSTYTSSS